MTDLENKKVEMFSPDDYEEFWVDYVEEIKWSGLFLRLLQCFS